MRLGPCIALELALAAGVAAGLWLGVGTLVDQAGDLLSGHPAAAATMAPGVGPLALGLPPARLDVPAPEWPRTVFEADDATLLAPLAATPVTGIRINRGGTSLSIRLEFASGARAAFKPEQVHLQSDPRREIAAYRLDRLLGIGHVAPAKPAAFAYDDLVAAADPEHRATIAARLAQEAVAHDGTIRGVVSWWIPVIRDGRIGDDLLDSSVGLARWESYLRVGAQVPPELRSLVTQLDLLVVFDVLIDNADRWSGANVKVSPDGATVFFMDNTLSFSKYTLGHENNLAPLRAIQVFSRAVVGRLRRLDRPALVAALALGDDPTGMGPLLTDDEIDAILSRRDHLLRYVDRLIAQYGEDAVLALP